MHPPTPPGVVTRGRAGGPAGRRLGGRAGPAALIRRHARRQACERRAAAVGWWVPAEPTVLRLKIVRSSVVPLSLSLSWVCPVPGALHPEFLRSRRP
jgi:hypothetical protein